MNDCIIGTAGHIDHGKTALIRALTGRNTDTLKEERQRGISIDLGYTYFELPGGRRAGIVDVPGHEKFLPNMLAGVFGMDMVLLVIALDEGVKPQTEEHMEILSQLGMQRGIIVLTKADCVEPEWADLMEEEIAEKLKETAFSTWERIRVSSVRGDGIEELKLRIVKMAGEVEHTQAAEEGFRMPVDRVLSLEGRGTVIAGTVLEGKIHRGETIELYPSGKHVRVRSIQSHGEAMEFGAAGQRTALLIAGAGKKECSRGDVAASPGTLRLSERLDVRLKLSKTTDRIVKNRMRVHLHIGTGQVLCRIILFGCEQVKKGESAYAQVLLEEPAAVKKGDRFIIRFYSPLETIGGGMVLGVCARRHKRADEKVLEYFRQLEEKKGNHLAEYAVRESKDKMLSRKELEKRFGEGEHICRAAEVLHGKKNEYLALTEYLDAWYEQMLNRLTEYREKHPYQNRISEYFLTKEVFPNWDADMADAFCRYLAERKLLQMREETFSCPECPIKTDKRFTETKEMLLKRLREAEYQFLNVWELRPEKMSEAWYRDILTTLEDTGMLVRISEAFYTTEELMRGVLARTERYFQEHEVLTYTALKEMLQTTRRSVRPLIAYLDSQRITAPCGKETARVKAERCGEQVVL